MSGIRIPIRNETEPRVLDTGEGSAVVAMGFTVPDIQRLLRWMLYAPKGDADRALGHRLLVAHSLVAELDEELASDLGYCPRCLTSMPCDLCGAGT